MPQKDASPRLNAPSACACAAAPLQLAIASGQAVTMVRCMCPAPPVLLVGVLLVDTAGFLVDTAGFLVHAAGCSLCRGTLVTRLCCRAPLPDSTSLICAQPAYILAHTQPHSPVPSQHVCRVTSCLKGWLGARTRVCRVTRSPPPRGELTRSPPAHHCSPLLTTRSPPTLAWHVC